MKLPPEWDDEDEPEGGGPNWAVIVLLAAYVGFFAWLLVR
jgi:hypothetical protein